MAEPVRAALAGYGYWGSNLARNIAAASTLELVGICDPSEDQRTAAARTYPGASTWARFEEVLDDDRVDAVVIAAPAVMHAEMTRAALAAGKHVLVEKPLTMTGEEADSVIEAQAKADRIVMVGHTFLYSPPVLRLGEMIDAGELGAIQYLYAQRLSLGRIRRDCNALWNFAPHDVSIMLHLLKERPVEVSGTSTAVIDPAVPDVFFASLRFPGGVSSHLHVSWIDPRKTRLMTIVGDQKMAIYNDVSPDQQIWVIDAGVARKDGLGEYESMGEFQWRTRAGDIHIPKLQMSEPLRNEMEAFGEACQTNVPPRTDVHHGAEVVKILEAIDASARLRGEPVELSW